MNNWIEEIKTELPNMTEEQRLQALFLSQNEMSKQRVLQALNELAETIDGIKARQVTREQREQRGGA